MQFPRDDSTIFTKNLLYRKVAGVNILVEPSVHADVSRDLREGCLPDTLEYKFTAPSCLKIGLHSSMINENEHWAQKRWNGALTFNRVDFGRQHRMKTGVGGVVDQAC